MSKTLTIPDVDDAVERKLQILAASHGRTVQAEAREILTQSVASAPTVNTKEEQAKPESARDAVRGLWKSSLSTDEVMELTRGDDSDDAYTR